MSSENSSQKSSLAPSSKQLKKLQKEFQKKKEQFYIKKRGLFRKAEQVSKHCNTDIFIVAYNNDTNNMFTFQSDPKFNLEKISDLVLKDVQQGMLFRNKKFVDEDFDVVQKNIKQLKAAKKTQKSTGKIGAPRMVETIINNDDSQTLQNSETVEELSMPMVNASTLLKAQEKHHQHVQKHVRSRYASPAPNPQRSSHGPTPATHQYTGGHDMKTPQVMYYQNQMPDMYTPAAEISGHHPSGSSRHFSQSPYARHTYATAAPYYQEGEVYHQMPPNHHQEPIHYNPNTVQYHPHQQHYPVAPVTQFAPAPEPRVSHFLQENERTSGATRGSVEPSKNRGDKSIDRMVDERNMRQAVNCDDIFMCCDRDYIRSRSRSVNKQSQHQYKRESSVNNEYAAYPRMPQPDIKKVNVPHSPAGDSSPVEIREPVHGLIPLRKPQGAPVAGNGTKRETSMGGQTKYSVETPQFDKDTAEPLEALEDQALMYHPVNQQYNYAINISYGQPPQETHEFEFMDVNKGKMTKEESKGQAIKEGQ